MMKYRLAQDQSPWPLKIPVISLLHLNIVRRSGEPPRCEASHFFTIIYSTCELLRLAAIAVIVKNRFFAVKVVKKKNSASLLHGLFQARFHSHGGQTRTVPPSTESFHQQDGSHQPLTLDLSGETFIAEDLFLRSDDIQVRD